MAAPLHTDILTKIIARLQGNAGVAALFTDVTAQIKNHLPQLTKDTAVLKRSPFMRVRWNAGTDWSGKDFQGYQGAVVVDVWTTAHGDLEVLKIFDAVNLALHNQPLTLAQAENIKLQHDFSDVFIEPDGVTHHGVQRFDLIATD